MSPDWTFPEDTTSPTIKATPTQKPSSDDPIIGTWKSNSDDSTEYYQFFKNGTFFYEDFYSPAYYESGTWKKTNGEYVITPTKQGYDSTNLVTVIGPVSSNYKLDGDKLVWLRNTKYTYSKINENPTPAPYVSPTAAPTMSPDEIKSLAKSVSYRELLTNSDAHFLDLVKISGRVIQVQKGTKSTIYLVDISTDYSSQIVMVNKAGTNGNIIEGDKVNMYGYVMGTKTYTTVLGADKEVPYIEYQYGEYYTK